MKNYVLGLDIGIASVGWGIIDLDSGEVVDAGVRLFKEGTAENNENRRSFRTGRRLIRRKKNRIKDLRELLEKNNIISSNFIPLNDPYDIRVKGLTNNLSNEELATALLHIVKNRGLVNDEIIPDEEEIKENEVNKNIISHNRKELIEKDYYICELQKERLVNGKVRGNNNMFLTTDYIKEIKKILSNQNVSKEFENSVIDIVKRKREYYEGPGSAKSPTPYGRFYFENGKLVEVDMIEKMRGKCSIYPDELRAPKMSYTADLFNFLNDLNNLTYDGDKKITPEQKKEIINEFINKDGKITPLKLAKFLGVDIALIKGFRIDKKDNPLLTEFKGYKKILKCVKDNKLNVEILENKEILDEIINILTSKKGLNERIESIRNIKNLDNTIYTDEVITLLSKLTGISGYHSLSLKVMNEVIADLINTEYNQMEIFSINKYFEHKKVDYKGLKNIPSNIDEILSPVVKISQNEAIKVINAVRKKYGELTSIIIEMPREKNSKDRKRRLNEIQKKNEEYNKKAEELLDGKKGNLTLRQKLRLYEEQDGKCLYTGKPIDLKQLINYPHMFEIDHIIPLSVSLEDSFTNKVLVYHEANQEKSNKTPYMYFKNKKDNSFTYEEYKEVVIALYKSRKITKAKKDNLLFEEDINKYEVRKKFINRNLVDTRYASRKILNDLTMYFNANEIPTVVHTVRGSFTDIFRKKSGLEKNRDVYKHHAVDALIIAGLKKMNLVDSMLKVSLFKDNESNEIYRVDRETGEIITKDNESEFLDEKFLDFISKLNRVEIKYSHKVDRKYNRSISKQTIYSIHNVDGTYWILGKCKDIYSDEGIKIADLFKKGVAEYKLLMYKADIETFKKLEEVVQKFKNSKNPFKEYLDQSGEYITKYSKSKKAPIIKQIRYLDEKLGKCIDISHNYNIKKDNKVVLLSLNPYRIDLYKTKNNKFVFIQIYQHHIKQKNGKVFIPNEIYNSLLDERGITNEDKFMFSIYKNEVLKISPFDEEKTYDGKILYAGVHNLESALINYKFIDASKIVVEKKELTRQYINIKNLDSIKKVNVDVLGNEYVLNNEESKPQLILK